MDNYFSRTSWLIGEKAMDKLQHSHIAVFGLGGVGSYAVEALARSGIGALTLVDNDRVAPSNINRQLIATLNTIGQAKTKAAADRIRQINPRCRLTLHDLYWPAEVEPELAASILAPDLDYIIDAIDSVGSKISLIRTATRLQLPIISCMGTGNKLDPSQLQIADIYDSKICPLARIMRRELRKSGPKSLKIVYSQEEPRRLFTPEPDEETKKIPPASCAFVPGTAGLLLASAVIRDLIRSQDS